MVLVVGLVAFHHKNVMKSGNFNSPVLGTISKSVNAWQRRWKLSEVSFLQKRYVICAKSSKNIPVSLAIRRVYLIKSWMRDHPQLAWYLER